MLPTKFLTKTLLAAMSAGHTTRQIPRRRTIFARFSTTCSPQKPPPKPLSGMLSCQSQLSYWYADTHFLQVDTKRRLGLLVRSQRTERRDPQRRIQPQRLDRSHLLNVKLSYPSDYRSQTKNDHMGFNTSGECSPKQACQRKMNHEGYMYNVQNMRQD